MFELYARTDSHYWPIMGLFESLFGKSESQTKLEREVSELKASLAAKEKSDAFLKALSNAGSVWVRKKSGTRQSHLR